MKTHVTEIARDAMRVVARPPVSGVAHSLGRGLSGVVVLLMLLDGATRLVPWPIVTETTERIGYGSSESLARCLGAISLVCSALYAFPPTSFVGAILTAGYLGSAFVSQLRIGGLPFTDLLFGFYLGVVVWGGLCLHNRRLRAALPLDN